MKKVAILKSNLLPISETFIKEQAISLQSWKGVLVGENWVEGGLDLTGVDAQIYGSGKRNWLSDQVRRFRNFYQLPNIALVQTLEKMNPDIVHVHFGTEGVNFWPSLKLLKKPVVITLHGYDITCYKDYWNSQKSPITKRYPKRLLELALQSNVHFVAVSEAIKQRAIEFGIPAEKVHVHYIGIDPSKFVASRVPIKEREHSILFVGRLTEKKCIMCLLEAFKMIIPQAPQAKLIVAGAGDDLEKAQDFVKANKLNVEFLGAVSHERVQQEMQNVRVFCLPSVTASSGDREGLPTVIMEAQSVGLPVITSAHGGADEGILDGETGFKFEEKDILTLTQHLITLLVDDELAQKMADKAPSFARERFDIKKCTQNLEAFYDGLAG